ncbi:hypothetical protein JXQ70_02250 [bacterium]|nr:hypothetical protein [bacterium]
MLRRTELFEQFELDYHRRQSDLTYAQALSIYEALWQHACALKAIPLADPLDGIDVDIRIARILHSCSQNS